MRSYRKNILEVIVLLLLFTTALISGCETTYVAPPPPCPAPSPTQAYSYQIPRSAGPSDPAEVLEKSIASLGGPRTIYHEVGPMETVWRIARTYGVSPESIMSANRLRMDDSLQIGQKLIVPNATMIRLVINLYRNPQWKYIIVHHTATGKGNARTINVSHGQRGFWNGLGYHFLIDNGTLGKGDGQIEMSPRWIRQQNGAHCKADGMNEKSIGICLVGNFHSEKPTPNQLQSLAFLLSVLRNFYSIPASNVMGHREVPGSKTECPGNLFPMNYLRQTQIKY